MWPKACIAERYNLHAYTKQDHFTQAIMSTNEFMARPSAEQKSQSEDLRRRLQAAYTLMDCRRALAVSNGDCEAAARYLTDGGWMGAKLISWNHAGLAETAARLKHEFKTSEQDILKVLKHCAGNEELARRKLSRKPVLD